METATCDKCGKGIAIGEYPYCPHGFGANSAISDSIPGGIYLKHGMCNADGSPRRYDSHSEIRAEAKRRNMVNRVEHIPERGSDKSKHTTRWT
jgi:hypothetical protein